MPSADPFSPVVLSQVTSARAAAFLMTETAFTLLYENGNSRLGLTLVLELASSFTSFSAVRLERVFS